MAFLARFRTFGCKLNQIETESLAAAFARAGFETVARGPAQVYVVNTCTVTSMAEQKARREIRGYLRESPAGVVIVTGCYASVSAADIAALGPRVAVFPGGLKSALHAAAADLAEALRKGLDVYDAAIAALESATRSSLDRPSQGGSFAFFPERFAFHSRASLKVEDGCDNRCAYCRVCIARGRAVSLDPETALARTRALEASGAREIVLTGVNLSQYRRSGLSFAGLLSKLTDGTESVRFRISSWEPDRVDGEFLEAFAHPRVCAHAHLAAQSGSDAVLARMGRRYDPVTVARAVRDIRAAKDDPFIGFDAISGFPGETDAEARESADFFASVGPAWIHAFTFSPRPGTRAISMRPLVPERVAAERSRELAAIGRRGRIEYAARWVGRDVMAVLEATGEIDPDDAPPSGDEPGTARADFHAARIAVADNYLRLSVPGRLPDGSIPAAGVLERLRIESATGDGSGGLGAPDARACFVRTAG
ncbi:MAG: tRNA (N(6)-L-threonylcarbamoyladenosine(37)-C(2))-methylthiotransferase MtaB [Spirochaetes bacterium]|nr:tRNA (N(6)-L-threonylcarbamoyladenosine(37)-C(2))-methylthiotransferase MtaB [Spirochaetota bacterium]